MTSIIGDMVHAVAELARENEKGLNELRGDLAERKKQIHDQRLQIGRLEGQLDEEFARKRELLARLEELAKRNAELEGKVPEGFTGSVYEGASHA